MRETHYFPREDQVPNWPWSFRGFRLHKLCSLLLTNCLNLGRIYARFSLRFLQTSFCYLFLSHSINSEYYCSVQTLLQQMFQSLFWTKRLVEVNTHVENGPISLLFISSGWTAFAYHFAYHWFSFIPSIFNLVSYYCYKILIKPQNIHKQDPSLPVLWSCLRKLNRPQINLVYPSTQ